MHPIIYDVAVSLDGYISGADGDVSKFAHEGPVVDDYMRRLTGYATAIMGRATYEFGFRFGLEPGQNPYPNMMTVVLSTSFQTPKNSSVSVWPSSDAEQIRTLKKTSPGPIYLCGGGALAGWMLGEGLIDRVILKRAPCIYGDGVSLFGNRQGLPLLTRIGTKAYDNGYLLEEFQV